MTMKKIILLLAICTSFNGYAQKFVVTPEGLRSDTDKTKSYVVIEVENATAQELYDRAIRYLQEVYKNPEEVIKGKTDGEYLRILTYTPSFIRYNNSGAKIPINAEYYTEIRFKDEKVRYEISSLSMKSNDKAHEVLFSGGIFSGYIIYKKNGNLFKESAKNDIENYFNTQINIFISYLTGDKQSANDEW